MRLKISVAGVRGVVGETLTPQLLARFTQAFGTYVGPGRVLVGRDTRPTGPMVADAVYAGLMATGCRPIDVGIAPIPSIQYRAATRTDVCGAIAITASHNPAEWNALKLLTRRGLFLSALHAAELIDIYNQGVFRLASGKEIPEAQQDHQAIGSHLSRVLELVDVDRIRRARLKVAVDCVNGAGAVATPRLLERLGCQVDALWCEPTGNFFRPPEPIPQNLAELCRRVRDTDAVVGLAQDADADRLAVVDENGRALDGDVMLTLLIDRALRIYSGPVVVNLSTSNLIEEVAARYGSEVFRSPVGEANVVEEMLAKGAIVGGEGSGGLIFPVVHYCRDSFTGMALLLDYLAQGGRVTDWVAQLPPRTRQHDRVTMPITQARSVLNELRESCSDAELDLRDGVKATWPEGWLHVRASNTEPIIRVVVEAGDPDSAGKIRQRAAKLIDSLK